MEITLQRRSPETSEIPSDYLTPLHLMDDFKIDTSFPLSLSIEIGNDWTWRSGMRDDLKNFLLFFSGHEIELVAKNKFLNATENFVFPAHNILDDDTKIFIEHRQLSADMGWLQTAVSCFFPGTDFELELLPADEEEENLLALRVYCSLSSSDFRKKRHAICKAMLEAGHENLFRVISIFQRRMHFDGREAFSWYSSLSAA